MKETAQQYKLTASNAERWLACTASPRLEKGVKAVNEYSKEGTKAHKLLEITLAKMLGLISDKSYNAQLRLIKKSEYYTKQMQSVVDETVTDILEIAAEAKAKGSYIQIFLELSVNLATYGLSSYGKIDICIVTDKQLKVIDFKYGQGTPVVAEDNAQLKLYALGAVEHFSLSHEFEEVEITVLQPRLDSISIDTVPVEELLEWGGMVSAIASLASAGLGNPVAGSWCKFCKVKNVCRAFNTYSLEATKYEFKAPEFLTESELLEVYDSHKKLKEYAESVKKFVIDKAANGTRFSGRKVVAGRRVTFWNDTEAVEKALANLGFTDSEILNKKVKSISDVKSMLSVDEFETYLAPLTEKTKGKPTVVLESDSRESILSDAVDEFFD